MIQINFNTGELMISGAMDEILTEYTILTKTITKQLDSLFNEEVAFKTLAGLGKVATDDFKKKTNPSNIYKKVVNEVLANVEVQI